MITVLFATPQEALCARPLLRGGEEISLPCAMSALRGHAPAGDLLVAVGGVGKVAAASAATLLCHLFSPRLLLVCGTAGALDVTLRLGEVVISREIVPADTGLVHSGGFRTTGPGIPGNTGLVFHPSFSCPAPLVERARRTAETARLKHRVGKTVTCDQAVLDPELRAFLRRSFGALAVDMESAAAAQVASSWGVPFLSVRAVSDDASFDPVGLEIFLPYAGRPRWSASYRRLLLAVRRGDTLSQLRLQRKVAVEALGRLGDFLREFFREPF